MYKFPIGITDNLTTRLLRYNLLMKGIRWGILVLLFPL